MRKVLRPGQARLMVPWLLLAAAACSDTDYRLGGAFPNGEDRGGTSGLGVIETGTAGAGNGSMAPAGKSDTGIAGSHAGDPSGGASDAGGREPNGGDVGGATSDRAGTTGSGGQDTVAGFGGNAGGGAGNTGASGGTVSMSGGAGTGAAAGLAGSGGSTSGSAGASGSAGTGASGSAGTGASGSVGTAGGPVAGTGNGGSLAGSGGSSGATGISGGAGISGGESGGANSNCVGSCSLISVDDCSSVPQCAPSGTCANGMTELPCANLSEDSCVQKTWCLWMGNSTGCKLQPEICHDLYQDQPSCSSTADEFSCLWKPLACSGTLNCALLENQAQCNSTQGCGWATGAPGKLTLSQSQLSFALNCPSPPVFTAKTITLTNTGGSTLTWSRTAPIGDFTVVVPSSGTLIPNAQVTVSITPAFSSFSGSGPTPGHDYKPADVTFTTNVSGDVAHTVGITESSNGYAVSPPASIDFGSVAVGTSVTKIISGAAQVPGAGLGSSNPDFVLNGVGPLSNGTWTLTFTPSAPGPASTTLTMGSASGCVFPPKTFTAYGNQ